MSYNKNKLMRFIIQGGYKLKGEVEIKGAKNNALKILAASLLFSNGLNIKNVPLIEDVFRLFDLLEIIGVKILKKGLNEFYLEIQKNIKNVLEKSIAERFRASIVLAGPLLARTGKVIFPFPGGCVIGKRPIDVFLDGWRALGAKIYDKGSFYEVRAKKLKGADYTFRTVSVTGTETLIMSAVLAEGETILRNVACEPEVVALVDFLNKAGAEIRGAGTPFLRIKGTNGRLLKALRGFEVIPDRIEAGSFLIIGALLGDPLIIKHCEPNHLSTFLLALKDAGVNLEIEKDKIKVIRPKKILSVDIKTREYPGFPTDLQAPFVVLMTQAFGQSLIFETVFDGRLNYIEDLNRMGTKIVMCDPHRILISGPTPLRGREVESPDLRAGLAFVIAALVAKGKSIINNIYQIDRGYEKIDERLRMLGAKIQRVD